MCGGRDDRGEVEAMGDLTGRGPQLGEMWFEELAFKLLHPAQQAIIQLLRIQHGRAVQEDLQVALEGQGHRNFKHHIVRLRKLNAIEVEASPTGPPRIYYYLTERPGRAREQRPGRSA
jgi:hypothetical protein